MTMDNLSHEAGTSLELTDMGSISDQETNQFNYARAVRRLIRKLDFRLIPFLTLLEFSSYIHQISIVKSHSMILFCINSVIVNRSRASIEYNRYT